jgi:hypothetical protein
MQQLKITISRNSIRLFLPGADGSGNCSQHRQEFKNCPNPDLPGKGDVTKNISEGGIDQ